LSHVRHEVDLVVHGVTQRSQSLARLIAGLQSQLSDLLGLLGSEPELLAKVLVRSASAVLDVTVALQVQGAVEVEEERCHDGSRPALVVIVVSGVTV